MSEKKGDIELRSDEVQEILTYVPNWMIRWGITLIFGILLSLLFIAWFVKYPDIVQGEITITTENPPVKITSLSSGQIQKIFLEDRAKVQSGDEIAEIETGVNPNNISFLKSTLTTVDNFMQNTSATALPNLDTNIILGVMQQDYNTLIANLKDFRTLINDDYYRQNVASLEKQIAEHKHLSTISKNELKITEKELANAKAQYDANKNLYDAKYMAELQFKEEETKYLEVEKAFERDKKTLVQIEITITQLEKQRNDLVFNTKERERQLIAGIQNLSRSLKNSINSWKHKQVLTAPINGEVCYLKNINENQYIKQGDEVFAIIPEDEHYIGYISLPVSGSGKVKPQQKVRIKLNNYPFHEYGQVDGVIEQISLVANDNKYMVKISLPNKLVSSYNKPLSFRPEMSGSAEIITEDLRLIERIFNSFRKLFDKT